MEDIIIKRDGNFGFDVWQGNKHSNHLGYDEMLGLISALTMPENRPCLQWMKSDEEWEKQSQSSLYLKVYVNVRYVVARSR
jgi:hypothetical protein